MILFESTCLRGLILVGSLMSCGTYACADPGKTTWTSYLYQGPGYSFSVVGELPQASKVNVGSCAKGWCQIQSGDRISYMREEVITRGSLDAPAAGVLPQPAAAVSNAPPSGPCVEANQTGGNGGHAPTIFCQRK